MKDEVFTVNGVQYISLPTTKRSVETLCEGCVAEHDDDLCDRMPKCFKVIFVKYNKNETF